MSKKVIILKGLPASGKSTWAKKKVLDSQGSYKRVNKDELRAMIDGGKYSKGNESFVIHMRDNLIVYALEEGKHVIVDDTNLHEKHEVDIRELVAKHNDNWNDNARVEIRYFLDVSPEECIERDLKRENSVGSKVILDMAKKYLNHNEDCIPELDTGAAEANGLPWCVIYDLDGTVSLMKDRSPYDASRCDELDSPNIPLIAILRILNSCKYHGNSENFASNELESSLCSDLSFIAFSGRSDEYEKPTRQFLYKYDVPLSQLFMRKRDDNRKDSIVKKEMYEQYIKGRYNVLVIFDDRTQVVDIWRKKLGLPCFQVNYGDF